MFKDVAARVCPNCREQYVDEAVTTGLLKEAEEAAGAGNGVEVWRYA